MTPYAESAAQSLVIDHDRLLTVAQQRAGRLPAVRGKPSTGAEDHRAECRCWVTDTGHERARRALPPAVHYSCTRPGTRQRTRDPQIHSSASEAAEVAVAAAAERLVLNHLPPFEASLDALLHEAQERMPAASLAADGAEAALPPSRPTVRAPWASATPTPRSVQVTGSSRKSA